MKKNTESGQEKEEVLMQELSDTTIMVVPDEVRHPEFIRAFKHPELRPMQDYMFDVGHLEQLFHTDQLKGKVFDLNEFYMASRHNELLERSLWLGDLTAIHKRGLQFFRQQFTVPLWAPRSIAVDIDGNDVMPSLAETTFKGRPCLTFCWRSVREQCAEPFWFFPRHACPRRDA